MSNKLRALSIALVAFFATTNANAAITFSNARAEASMSDVSTAYITVVSTQDDVITAVASDCCKAVELHTNEVKDNVMRMRKIETLPLKANVPVTLQRSHGLSLAAPGATMTTLGGIGMQESMHMMLIGLHKPLKKGDVVKVTFTFEHAPQQTLAFTVGNAQLPMMQHKTDTPMDHSMDGMDMETHSHQ